MQRSVSNRIRNTISRRDMADVVPKPCTVDPVYGTMVLAQVESSVFFDFGFRTDTLGYSQDMTLTGQEPGYYNCSSAYHRTLLDLNAIAVRYLELIPFTAQENLAEIDRLVRRFVSVRIQVFETYLAEAPIRVICDANFTQFLTGAEIRALSSVLAGLAVPNNIPLIMREVKGMSDPIQVIEGVMRTFNSSFLKNKDCHGILSTIQIIMNGFRTSSIYTYLPVVNQFCGPEMISNYFLTSSRPYVGPVPLTPCARYYLTVSQGVTSIQLASRIVHGRFNPSDDFHHTVSQCQLAAILAGYESFRKTTVSDADSADD